VKNSSLFYLFFLIYFLPILSNIASVWHLKKSVNNKKGIKIAKKMMIKMVAGIDRKQELI